MTSRLLIRCSCILARRIASPNILQRHLDTASISLFISSRCYSDFLKTGKSASAPIDNDKKLRIIKTELIHKQSNGKLVPDLDDMSADDWNEVLGMSNAKRLEYYGVLYRRHYSEKNEKIKRDIRKVMVKENERISAEAKAEITHIPYGLGRNTLLMKIYSQTMDRWRNHKIFRNLLHQDSHLIFDCGFENEMTPYEIRNTAKQLMYAFGDNRQHFDPFFIHLTNVHRDSKLRQSLLKAIPTIEKPTLPIRITGDEFPDNISKDRLVYLTPDSPNDLFQFNHEDVYIIGAIVEKGPQKPLLMAKAKRLGIRTARLPLSRIFQWKQSSKHLTINQVAQIMLDFKASGDIHKSCVHVPGRKVTKLNDSSRKSTRNSSNYVFNK